MATITTRSGKGSPLTNNEVDANFTNLNTDKQEVLAEGSFADGDKTKLDGIETGATADQTAQEIATSIDADATAEATLKSALGLGTAAYTASTDYATAAQGALADSALQANQTITLSGDVSGSGTTSISVTVADDSHNHVISNVDGLQTALDGKQATGDYVVATGDSMTGNLSFGDNDKAIFGAGSDLQIYHNGTDSKIYDGGTGNLEIITNGTQVQIDSTTGNMIRAVKGDEVVLFHNNNRKLATTSTGIDVTGTVTADGLTVDGSTLRAKFNGSAYSIIDLTEGDTTDLNTSLYQQSGDFNIYTTADDGTLNNLRIKVDHSTGDISFYEDTGTTPKFFWDASAESLGIGTSSTTSPGTGINVIDIKGTGAGGQTDRSGGITLTRNDGNVAMLMYHSDGVSNLTSQSTYPLAFVTNNTERMRIDSSGNVGIGTSSPELPLHIERTTDGSATGYLNITRNGNTADNWIGHQSNSSLVLSADEGSVSTASSINFRVDGSERMRIDSSGRVGIGTSSPSVPFHVNSGAENIVAKFESSDADALIQFTDNATSDTILLGALTDDLMFRCDPGNIIFNTNNNSEAMRIDSNGTLLVGTTDTLIYNHNSSGDDGVVISYGGTIQATGHNGEVMHLNRTTSDGPIVDFRKDGTQVGSIGTASSDLTMGTSNTGIRFADGDESWRPHNPSTGSDRNNVINIGSSSQRFKDLYLGGGVYLGGTGSNNYLDDYEEGTWNPEFIPESGSFTTTDYLREGRYVKVGGWVFLTFSLSVNIGFTPGTASGYLSIGNFPFSAVASANTNNDQVYGVSFQFFSRWNNSKSDHYLFGTYENQTSIGLRAGNINTDLGASSAQIQVSDMLTGTYVQNRIAGSIIYKVA